MRTNSSKAALELIQDWRNVFAEERMTGDVEEETSDSAAL